MDSRNAELSQRYWQRYLYDSLHAVVVELVTYFDTHAPCERCGEMKHKRDLFTRLRGDVTCNRCAGTGYVPCGNKQRVGNHHYVADLDANSNVAAYAEDHA